MSERLKSLTFRASAALTRRRVLAKDPESATRFSAIPLPALDGEQIAGLLQRLLTAQIHKYDVPSRQQFGVGAEHRVDGGDLAAVGLQRLQTRAQRRL